MKNDILQSFLYEDIEVVVTKDSILYKYPDGEISIRRISVKEKDIQKEIALNMRKWYRANPVTYQDH